MVDVIFCIQVYGGVYRRPTADVHVAVVDNYEGVLPGSIVAVNLDGNYKPPHLAEVKQVDDASFIVQWLNGCLDAVGSPPGSQRKVPFTSILNWMKT